MFEPEVLCPFCGSTTSAWPNCACGNVDEEKLVRLAYNIQPDKGRLGEESYENHHRQP